MQRPVRISTLPTYLLTCSPDQFTHINSLLTQKVVFEDAMFQVETSGAITETSTETSMEPVSINGTVDEAIEELLADL